MFLYMFAGYILFRTEKMTIRGSRDIANLLVCVVIPAVIVDSFCVDYSHAKLLQLAQSAFLSALGIAVAMIIAAVIFRKHPIDNFGSAMETQTGLSLPVCHNLMQLMGGSIDIKSDYGQQTTITVALPCQPIEITANNSNAKR